MKQTIEIDVPEGYEVTSAQRIGSLLVPLHEVEIMVSVMLRRVHVWPEAVLQYARHMGAPWMAIDKDGEAYLYGKEPSAGVNSWSKSGRLYVICREWAPPHDHTGKGWRNCKWRLPVEDKQ